MEIADIDLSEILNPRLMGPAPVYVEDWTPPPMPTFPCPHCGGAVPDPEAEEPMRPHVPDCPCWNCGFERRLLARLAAPVTLNPNSRIHFPTFASIGPAGES